MNWLEFLEWSNENYQIYIFIIIILGAVSYVTYMNYKHRKKPEPEQKAFSEKVELADNIELTEEFVSINFMEDNNRNRITDQLKYVQEELKEKIDQYHKGRNQYKQLVELDARLRTYIQILQRQEKIFKEETERLKNGS